MRAAVLNKTITTFEERDNLTRFEMLSEVVSGTILGGAFGGPAAELVGEMAVLGSRVEVALSTSKFTLFTKKSVDFGIKKLNTRRAYLNVKFDRTGDLNVDISYRGYMDAISKFDVSSGIDSAIFYSGNNGLNRLQAINYARQNESFVIDFTPGGKYLMGENLYERLPPDLADAVWISLSKNYANQASGNVNVFITNADKTRVFHQIELPILTTNPNVMNIFEKSHLDLTVPYISHYETAIQNGFRY